MLASRMDLPSTNLVDFMDPSVLPQNSPYTLLPGAVSLSGAVAQEPESGPAAFGGRFSVVRSYAQPAFSVNYLSPGMSQARDDFHPDRFGSGVSSVSDVSRNLSLHNDPSMTPAVNPFYWDHQELAGIDTSSAYWPCGRAATSTRAVDMGEDSCQPASFEMVKSKAATSESYAQQAGLGNRRKKRKCLDQWQTQELNKVYQRTRYLTSSERFALASRLEMTEIQVKKWFSNKRTNAKTLANKISSLKSIATLRGDSRGDSQALSTKQQMPSVFDQSAMASAFVPYHREPQELAGLGVSHGHLPDYRVVNSSKTAGKKRTVFPEWKINELNKAFQRNNYITGEERSVLASQLQMTELQVQTWFQNKRSNVKAVI